MKLNTRQSGFTLIEIMVVIVIIGLLASIIIFVSREAKLGAYDAKIKSELDTFRKQAELLRGLNGGPYTFDCYDDFILIDVERYAKDNDISCLLSDNSQSYAVVVQLNKGENSFFCVDGNGYSGFGDLGGDEITGYFCNRQ